MICFQQFMIFMKNNNKNLQSLFKNNQLNYILKKKFKDFKQQNNICNL